MRAGGGRVLPGRGGVVMDLEQFIAEQIEFSRKTFGEGPRTLGVIAHIREELVEIEQAPTDLQEWVDVMLLAFDGAWRHGWSPTEICAELRFKLDKNKARTWPPINDGTKPMKHVRS